MRSKHEAPKKTDGGFNSIELYQIQSATISLTHSPNNAPQTKKHQPLLKETHTDNASLLHPSRNTTSWTCWCFPPSLLFQSHHDLERRVRLSLLVWQICQNLPPMVAPPHSSLIISAAFKGRKEGCRFAPFWG